MIFLKLGLFLKTLISREFCNCASGQRSSWMQVSMGDFSDTSSNFYNFDIIITVSLSRSGRFLRWFRLGFGCPEMRLLVNLIFLLCSRPSVISFSNNLVCSKAQLIVLPNWMSLIQNEKAFCEPMMKMVVTSGDIGEKIPLWVVLRRSLF